MILIQNIKLDIHTDFNDLKSVISSKLRISKNLIKCVKINKRAIDARNKNNIHYNCSFIIETDNEQELFNKIKKFKPLKYEQEEYKYKKAFSDMSPIIVGFGPAGIFAALTLAKAGLRPIVIERGQDVDTRTKDVEDFFNSNILNEESNVQFGEGGAGTFSDGKLNTGISDTRIKEILKIFNRHGAPEKILFDSKPHIGTDVLKNVVKSIRNEIISLGGKVLFGHKLIGFTEKNNTIIAKIQSESTTFEIEANALVLAIGHSARDTFELLKRKGVLLTPKPFAIGARIEHRSNDINKAQFGDENISEYIGSADYKLFCHLPSGRSVFTFCMCPGGEVINSSSEKGTVTTNGMSKMARNGINSNSAILVNVEVEDYYNNDVLDGMYFQREIEKRVFELTNGIPLCQTVGSLLNGNDNTSKYISPTIKPTPKFDEISKVLPSFVIESIKEALPIFDKKLKGFALPDAILTVPETRSSSPIRINRNEQGESSINHLYPCGEGAGYAGGIMSAAVDGIKTAEKIIDKINEHSN